MPISSKKLLVRIVGAALASAAFLGVSYYVNNPSVAELAGRWTVSEMDNINPIFRYYMWENLNFTIEPTGFIGNRNTSFTMIALRGNCKPDCYYVDDFVMIDFIPGAWLMKLVRDTPNRLLLYPTDHKDAKIVFVRRK
jgi:hypothetical protein